MKQQDHEQKNRRVRGLAAVCLLLVSFLTMTPFVASAQVPLPVTIVADPDAAAKLVIDEVVTKPFQVAFMTIIWNFLTFVTNRIAYDAAVAIATAGNGEEPLIELRNPEKYFIDLGEDVAGAAVDALSQTLEAVNIHFNLCAPRAPAFRLALQLGIKSAYERPEPDCQFQDFTSNWQGFVADSFGDDHPDQALITNFAQAINPRSTDLTASIALYTQVFEDDNLNKSVGFGKYLSDHGFKDVSDAITGTTKTPANIIDDAWKESTEWGHTPDAARNQFNNLLQARDLWKQLGLSALSTFTNTLLSKLTDRVYSGLFDIKIDEDSPFDVASIGFGGGVEAAEAHFRTIFTVEPISLDSYNIISEFTTCPGTTTRQLNNCTMDSNFATAVGSADGGDPFTVQEAIDEGLINGDWPLIGPTDARNVDDRCYTYGFCYANLVRMRLARVIPVGWELAAELQDGSNSDTLQTVINAFDDCTEDGERDPDHQYCHLIDPNWVLKYPASQCDASVSGQLVSDFGNTRGTECVDAPSCIQEDASGNCVGGYGYCAREKNSWNFRGDDCPEQFATCLSFENEEGEVTGDWILNTVDPDACDEDNAGCLWYSTVKEEISGAFDWPVIDDVPADDAAADTYLGRLYFNNNVEECDADDAGCTRVVERTDDVSVNLIINPSFEDDEDGDDLPDNWTLSGGSYDTSADNAVVGSDNIAGGAIQTDIPIQTASFYTFSFYAAQPDSTTNNSVSVSIEMASEDGSEGVDLTGTSYDTTNCALSGTDTITMNVAPDDEDYQRFTCTFTSPTFSDADLAARIQSLSLTSTDVLIDGVQLEASEDVGDFRDGYGVPVDDMNPDYYKLPPDYLGCTGDSTVDPEECSNYAPVCTAADVGCQLYTPVNGDPSVPGIISDLDQCPEECAGYDTYKQEPTLYEPDGDFPLYFIPDTAVSCSEQYVGCDEFTNLADEGLEYYTYLRACLATDQTTTEANYYTWEGSDLEGFQLKSWVLLESDLDQAPCTNWDAAANTITCDDDATAIAATTQCDEHDDIFSEPDCREFYDADGNIHYRLFSETVTVTDECNNYRKTDVVGDDTAEQESNCEGGGGYWDATLGECRFYGFPDESTSCPVTQNGCREYTGGAGRNSSVVFEDDVEDDEVTEYVQTSTGTSEISNESVATDGHSIHFTAGGNGDYVAVGVGEVVSNCSESDGCDIDTAGACDESNGCDVEVGTIGFSCTVLEGETHCGELVDQLAPAKVYVLSFWAKGASDGVVITPTFIEEAGTGAEDQFDDVELSVNWEKYTVGPLDTSDSADFDDTAILAFMINDTTSGTEFYLDNLTLRQTEEAITVIKDSWETPSTCDETEEGASSPQYHLGCQEYTDSAGDSVFLKSFTRLCSEDKIGCEDFFNTQSSDSAHGAVYNMTCEYQTGGTAVTVGSNLDCEINGETLCTIEAGSSGCLFDVEGGVPRNDDQTLLSEDAGEGFGFFMELGPETRVVRPDEVTYFVASDTYRCDESVMGCTEVGLPTFNEDQTRIDSWTDTYLLDVVDDYDDILCSQENLFCDAWTTTQDGTFYFKNPETKTCEYRTDVVIGGTEYSGWFRTGTNEFCYGTGSCSIGGNACDTDSDCTASTDEEEDECDIDTGTYLIGGTESGMWRNGDDLYDGWVGTCDSQYDLCSEFIDPVDVAEGETYDEDAGESYFFLNNDLLDEENLANAKRCNGQVSQKSGCVLFENTTNAELNYNASASYVLSVHADQFYSDSTSYDLVDPISCPDGGEVTTLAGVDYDLCTTRCAYSDEDLHPYDSSASGSVYTTSCLTNADCPDVESDGGDLVSGTCETGVDALENDTNEIQKVNLDRACAEWFSCTSTTKVWDDSEQEYTNVCDSIGLCDEYTALGESTACADWVVDDVPTVLTADRYAARNTGWYGREYSGFSIPSEVLAHHLAQLNVNPARVCAGTGTSAGVVTDGGALPFIDCTEDDAICDDDTTSSVDVCTSADEDFRLVFDAGTCDSDTGEDCTIGFCAATGAACGDDTDCEGTDTCAIGYCAHTPSGFTSPGYQTCTTDSNCTSSTFDTCIDGICSDITTETCDGVTPCDVSAFNLVSCQQAVNAYDGMCVNQSCLLLPIDDDMDGDLEPFSYDDSEVLDCRGWPENTSPFPNGVVETWVDPTDPSDEPSSAPVNIYYRPYEMESTFEDVSTCAAFGDCLCSYEKVSYGSMLRYYDQDYASIPTYLCVGGSNEGMSCRPGEATETTCTDGGGTCTVKDAQETPIGMDGFCLQRDTAINVNGDQSTYACLAWLPIDRPAGASDIFGKSTEAGYPLEDTFYCAEPEMYVDLGASFADTANNNGACAEHPGSDCGADDYDCSVNADCPDGYYAVMSRCSEEDADAESGFDSGTLIGGCYDAIADDDGGVNDCPYVCVPDETTYGDTTYSYDSGSGTYTACDNPIDLASSSFEADFSVDTSTSSNGTLVYEIHVDNADGAAPNYDLVADYYQDCYKRGIANDSNLKSTFTDFFGTGSHQTLFFTNANIYPGCTTVVHSASTAANVAWTNRVLFEGTDPVYLFEIDDAAGDVAELFYNKDTGVAPFGRADDPNIHNDFTDEYPVALASCVVQPSDPSAGQFDGTEVGFDWPVVSTPVSLPTGATFDVCSSGTAPEQMAGGNTEPEGRSFIDIEAEGTGYMADDFSYNGETLSDSIDRIGQIFADVNIDNMWVWSNSSQVYVETSPSSYDSSYDTVKSDTGDDLADGDPSAPVVKSIGSVCVNQYCREGTDGKFSVNGDDSVDLTGSGGSFFADLKFFVEANPNQMPIRRVIVDWADEDGGNLTGSLTDDNYYKNRRGLSETNDQICTSASEADNWGETTDACDSNYFNAQHYYTCSEARATSLPACTDSDGDGILDISPCTGGGYGAVCVFQPRVHVRDNWGWCTGTCPDTVTGEDGTDGCYDADGVISTSTDQHDECDLDRPNNSPWAEDDPWVYYDGVIAVEP